MDKDIELLLTQCKDKWGQSDEKMNYFSSNLPRYLENLSPEMKDIILLLINYFDYYSHQLVNTYLKDLHNRTMEHENIDIGNSVFCVLKSQRGTINSSYEYLIEYRHLNGIGKYSIVPELNDIATKEYWGYIDNIILIDDFCGSGKTFVDYIEKNKNILIGKHIVYIVIHIMDAAVSKIEAYAKKNEISIEIVYEHKQSAAFSSSDELGMKRECFKEESLKMDFYNENDIFGFSKSESLVSFYNDTPNNTLGVFWKNTSKNNALFPRNNERKPAWMRFKSDKKQRNESDYAREKKKYNG